MRTRIFSISLLSWHCFKDCNSSGHQLLYFPSLFLLVSLITLSGKQLSGFSWRLAGIWAVQINWERFVILPHTHSDSNFSKMLEKRKGLRAACLVRDRGGMLHHQLVWQTSSGSLKNIYIYKRRPEQASAYHTPCPRYFPPQKELGYRYC